jgi:hypothetical protein
MAPKRRRGDDDEAAADGGDGTEAAAAEESAPVSTGKKGKYRKEKRGQLLIDTLKSAV